MLTTEKLEKYFILIFCPFYIILNKLKEDYCSLDSINEAGFQINDLRSASDWLNFNKRCAVANIVLDSNGHQQHTFVTL